MKKILLLLLLITSGVIVNAQDFKPLGVSGDWVFQEDYSHEFDEGKIKKTWKKNLNTFPAWTATRDNLDIAEGKLKLSLTWEPHTVTRQLGDVDYYFKSSVIASKEKIRYGYFEARIKGATTFPGASPAFWLYDNIKPAQSSEVSYTEIDCPEIQSKKRDANVVAWNVVHREREGDRRVPIRQETGCDPNNSVSNATCHQNPLFDPSADFHVYACLWDEDKIEFYIDGKKVGNTIQNEVHKFPMTLIMSIGLREPYYRYDPTIGRRVPIETLSEPAGFPVTCEVDYIRVWQRGGNGTPDQTNGTPPDETDGTPPDETDGNADNYRIVQNNNNIIIFTKDVTKNVIIKLSNSSKDEVFKNVSKDKRVRIPIKDLPSGKYTLKIRQGKELFTQKLDI